MEQENVGQIFLMESGRPSLTSFSKSKTAGARSPQELLGKTSRRHRPVEKPQGKSVNMQRNVLSRYEDRKHAKGTMDQRMSVLLKLAKTCISILRSNSTSTSKPKKRVESHQSSIFNRSES